MAAVYKTPGSTSEKAVNWGREQAVNHPGKKPRTAPEKAVDHAGVARLRGRASDARSGEQDNPNGRLGRRAPERPDGDWLHPFWRPPRGSNPPEIAPQGRRGRSPDPSRTSCGASGNAPGGKHPPVHPDGAPQVAQFLLFLRAGRLGLGCFPRKQKKRRGVPGTQWVHIDQSGYDTCRDWNDYRSPKK